MLCLRPGVSPMRLVPLLLCVLVGCARGYSPLPADDAASRPLPEPEEQSVREKDQHRVSQNVLTRAHAIQRKSRLAGIRYELNVDLVSSPDEYSGTARIEFTLLDAERPLTIDFSGGRIDDFMVNGAALEPDYDGFFITVPASALARGANSITISYRHSYSDDGNGLYRFTDPEDGYTYLYTYLWPYYANRLFPCFDQPDLRATYELVVRAPADWVVVSVNKETSILEFTNERGDQRIWRFPETPPLSTYIFSLHAGPYHVWEARAGKIPMRLMARRSFARYVDADEWFLVTQQGIDFYQTYFDIPYPFRKYDQLIVPDFNISGMENAAAVTYSEQAVSRGAPTREEREGLALLILHETAHMWFGDLVTMSWWNGLWLNESFATFMSYLAAADGTEFSDVWDRFYLTSKQNAYRADQLVTTHPIEMPIPDTGAFFSVFDSITYGKGASVLKQLVHSLGADVFRTGVSRYLKQFAWQNTVLGDFTTALADAAQIDMDPWVQEWLHEPGLNTLTVDYECNRGKIAALSLVQGATETSSVLRRHRLQLGFYAVSSDGAMRLRGILPVSLAGALTGVPAARDRPCPALIYPNHDDWAYVKVVLPEEAVQPIAAHINDVSTPLARAMLWQALWDMARDGRLSLPRFADIVLLNIAREQNEKVLHHMLTALTDDIAFLQALQAPQRDEYLGRVERFLWSNTLDAPQGSDLQKLWLDHFVAVALTDEAVKVLADLLAGARQLPGTDIDQDRRWMMIARLNAAGYPGAESLVDAERRRDASAAGAKRAIGALAGRPNSAVKTKWLDEFSNTESPLSFSEQRAAMEALFPSHQSTLQHQHLEKMLRSLPTLSSTRDDYFLAAYVGWLFRGVCRKEDVDRLGRVLEESDGLNVTVIKFLREAHQESERCVALAKLL